MKRRQKYRCKQICNISGADTETKKTLRNMHRQQSADPESKTDLVKSHKHTHISDCDRDLHRPHYMQERSLVGTSHRKLEDDNW